METKQTPSYWQQAIDELSLADAVIAEIIARYPNEKMQGRGDAFHTLLRSITGQQISVVAADAIWNRLEKAVKSPSPHGGEGRGEGRNYNPLNIQNARHLRQNQTEVEKILWAKLRNRQIANAKFRRQQPLGNYVVDFICAEKKLVIELDGGQHNESESDKKRDRFIRGEGYTILRFWNNEVTENIEGVLQVITGHLSPHPNPLPQGERELKITPETIANLDEESLRACGYSRMKVSYLHSLADFFLSRQHLERDWAEMSDEEVVKDITQIKGIGVWTAEMFLMFHLLRPNVLPLGDIGLLNGVAKHYHEGERKPLSEVSKLAKKWQPWRSVATWYLWRSLDDVAVAY